MTEIPLTRIAASTEKAAAIRAAVRAVNPPVNGARRLARIDDAPAFFELIKDPRVSGPIYTLPKPPSLDGARAFIEKHIGEHARGDGLLMFDFDEAGAVAGYHDIQFWPQWAACELGGAVRPDLQGGGSGTAGAAMAFAWLFNMIGVDLICETAALDNIRTQKLLVRLGFNLVREIESATPGGGVRPSLYYEMTRENWRRAQP
jgi:RimJ/RimL family protein N-acetyltransferase